MALSIIHLYVHFNISVIRLVVITQVISHHVSGHQGLPSVLAKLTNTISDAYKLSRVCYRPRGDKQKKCQFLCLSPRPLLCAHNAS